MLNLGTFKNTPASVNKLLKKLAGRGDISVCYEAEPTAAQFEGTLDESWLVSGISLLVLALVLGLSISLDLSRLRSGLLRAMCAKKETEYGSDTQRRVQAECGSHCACQEA
ncbi:hypothetical protein JWJ88_21330 (plasmid) [Paracoccus methylovorus]|uniref:Uncharacterized protein n=1 Tax=Paracoccus methylovorus TaxID=2812658 RepID=A0ABX7JP94_9RHOB|nr:hypothetical protein [Paracoccus methylovorus]QRZ16090.1 hypothetical protein JWJ88_21330 [Paracoccus methylovorus]